MKYLAAAALGALALYAFVVNFSAVTSSFKCSGAISSIAGSRPATLNIKLEEYRWWVGLWGDSDGALRLELPNELFEYYGHVIEGGDQLEIFARPGELKGTFSTLSKTLALNTPGGFFDGVCTKSE